MRKNKPTYAVRRHPEPTILRKWACMDMRDQSIVASFKRRANAVSCAGLANSVLEQYGSLTPERVEVYTR